MSRIRGATFREVGAEPSVLNRGVLYLEVLMMYIRTHRFLDSDCEVNHRAVRYRDSERHTCQLPERTRYYYFTVHTNVYDSSRFIKKI